MQSYEIFSTCFWIYCHIPLWVFDANILNSMTCSSLVPLSSCTINHDILLFEIPWSCPMYSQDIPSCPYMWLISIHFSVFCSPLLFIVGILPPHSSVLLVISCVTHDIQALLLTFQPDHSQYRTHISCTVHCISTFPLSDLTVPSFYSTASCTFWCWAYNLSKFLSKPFNCFQCSADLCNQ
jgi:hypothetical protein